MTEYSLELLMKARFINCEVCQNEGRIYTSNGGPDEIDNGVCPACNGERVVEVEAKCVGCDGHECDDGCQYPGVSRS